MKQLLASIASMMFWVLLLVVLIAALWSERSKEKAIQQFIQNEQAAQLELMNAHANFIEAHTSAMWSISSLVVGGRAGPRSNISHIEGR